MNATVGSDLIYALTLEDKEGNAIVFSNVISMEVTFTSDNNDVITKTIVDGDITQGSNTNVYNVELQDADTTLLGVGIVDVLGKITLPDTRFSDNEATTTFKTKLVIE